MHGITRGRASPSEDACGPPLFASGIRIRPRSCPNLVPPAALDGTIEGEMPGNVLFFPYALVGGLYRIERYRIGLLKGKNLRRGRLQNKLNGDGSQSEFSSYAYLSSLGKEDAAKRDQK